MKILFLSYKFYPDIGGIEIISELLSNAFTEAGHVVHLVTTSTKDGDKNFSFKIVRRPSFIMLLKEYYWADVIFENNLCLNLSWPGFFFKKPSVISIQTWIQDINGEIRWRDKLKIHWLKRASQVVACSNSIRNRLFPSSIVIQNPYNDLLFKTVDTPRVNTFVFLGRLVSDKGVDLAIKALHKLIDPKNFLQHLPNYTLTIIGDGPEKEDLIRLVDDLNLSKNVFFAGSLSGPKLVSTLNQYKYILIPSIWEEPFGIVALEGMACGCIPIVADGGGLPDAVGKAGLIFKRGDVEELVAAIRKIIDNKGLEQKLYAEVKGHLKAHTRNVVSQEYLKIIEKAFNYKN